MAFSYSATSILSEYQRSIGYRSYGKVPEDQVYRACVDLIFTSWIICLLDLGLHTFMLGSKVRKNLPFPLEWGVLFDAEHIFRFTLTKQPPYITRLSRSISRVECVMGSLVICTRTLIRYGDTWRIISHLFFYLELSMWMICSHWPRISFSNICSNT